MDVFGSESFGTYMLTVALVVCLVLEAITKVSKPWGVPLLLMYGTTVAWYLVDYLYNYENFVGRFQAAVINEAFAEVALYLISLRLLVEGMRSWYERNDPNSPQSKLFVVTFSNQNEMRLFRPTAGFFIGITIVGIVLVDWDVLSLICPPLSSVALYPWGRDGLGQGFDFLLSTGGYLHQSVVAFLGVFVAISTNRQVRAWATVLFVVGLQAFLYGRARNITLGAIAPSIIAYVLARDVTAIRKFILVAICGIAINFWFLFIATHRDRELSIAHAVAEGEVAQTVDDTHHYGLDMLSELCYINSFIEDGTYQINWGQRYLAEILNFVPRTIWPDKPTIGVDYAIARGFGDKSKVHGINTSVATGIIGGGLVNFGQILGPVAVAALSAVWVGILARLWVDRQRLSRFLLYMIGFGLTFNVGRDITLMALWPFVFSYLVMLIYERWQPEVVDTRFESANGLPTARFTVGTQASQLANGAPTTMGGPTSRL